MIEIHGVCPPRFEAVRAAFADNFVNAPEGLNEIAARFSVCVEGQTVIDLLAGHADQARTREADARTLMPVFSTGKAVMALLIATAVERGKLAYEEKVAHLWPAFEARGKGEITVGQLMSHQGGLAGFDAPADPSIWFDPPAVAEQLATQAPLWAPGAGSGYHPVTIGFLANEVFRRAEGRTLGRALKADFPELDLWWGLPESEHGRVADFRKPAAPADLGEIDPIKRAAFLDRGSAPGGRGAAAWREAEIPSTNLHATALDLARIMSVIADGGRFEGRQVLSTSVLQQAIRERSYGRDRVLPFTLSWAAGFTRNKGLGELFGPNPDAVGHCGWGGSLAFADPKARVSGAYAMTRQSNHLIGDPRPRRLIQALYSAM